MAWFHRRQDDGDDTMDPSVLLARAETAASFSTARFDLTVGDVFTITGRGTVVTGTIDTGHVKVGDAVTLVRSDGSTRELTVSGIEMFRKTTDSAVAGDNVGLLLGGIERGDIARGDRLVR